MKKTIFAAILLSTVPALAFVSCAMMADIFPDSPFASFYERQQESTSGSKGNPNSGQEDRNSGRQQQQVQPSQQTQQQRQQVARLVWEGNWHAYEFELYKNPAQRAQAVEGRQAAESYGAPVSSPYASSIAPGLLGAPTANNTQPSQPEQHIDLAIEKYEAALNQWPGNESIELTVEIRRARSLDDGARVFHRTSKSEVQALLERARNEKQQLVARQQAAQQAEQAEQARLQAEAALTTPNGPEDFDVAQNTDGGITITNYKGTRRHVIIPDTLYGLRVTRIGKRAFYRKGLISVVIPNTVITMETDIYPGEHFAENNLEKVTLGNSLRQIGRAAFKNNPLTEITIPDSVTDIYVEAFRDCKLTRISFGRGLRNISERAFAGNSLGTLVIPDGVTKIDTLAFAGNPLTTLVIPASLAGPSAEISTQSGFNAFEGNSLTRVTLPANFNPRNRGGIDQNLINYYTGQGSRAGTYVKNGPVWVRE